MRPRLTHDTPTSLERCQGIEFKQVIIVRSDLKMSKGKIAVQVAHASVIAAFEAFRNRKEWFDKWWDSGQKKIVVKVGSERELLDLYEKARSMELPASIVRDAGLTEVPPGTLTAVAIGPAPSDLIDKLTGGLKLL
ncbi:peptidyl-tRNA hydrolase Pth2 [Thermogladius sp. 4427co]|uniref:peptidyl-tRNA hydrolase Pth2 n=1 Tax=Thermogladius sp. 4427co TaxID=3450718 RepID=UPI003F79E1DD